MKRRRLLPVRKAPPPETARAGYTLTEILIATAILGMAVTITLVVFVAALKRAQHTEDALKATAELRYGADLISQTVRSAARLPTIAASGTQLIVPPKDLGYATVQELTWIDATHTVSGSKANQRMLHVSNATLPMVVIDAWATGSRPAGALASSDVAVYFKSPSALPSVDLRDIFSVGDTVTIPATPFGAEKTGVINSISNNPGDKTLTLQSNLGVDVPNGTRIAATAGRRVKFEVTATGELRYYRDHRDATKYVVLARDIDPSPLSNPANPSGPTTVPFAIDASAPNYVVINLQKIPRGTRLGRTLQGVQTTVFSRTDPSAP